MKRGDDKIESEIKKLFNKTGLENPSSDFTYNVMANVQVEMQPHQVSCKPVINVKGWILVASIVALLALLVVLLNPSEFSWWPTIQLSDIQLPDLFGAPFQNQISTLILIFFIAIIALTGCDYLLYKFREKDILGIF